MLLVALISGLLAWKMDKVRKQQAAVAWIRGMSRQVAYSYELDENGNALNNPQPSVPDWLIDLLSIDFFYEVEGVNLINTKTKDLSPLRQMTGLRYLCLINTPISDLSPLARLTNLQELDLTGTEVSDLSPLTKITGLRRLCIDYTPVSDLTPLAEIEDLRWFYCAHTPVSDLSPLATQTGMLSLNLTGTPISDISALSGMKSLENLDMRDTPVEDLSPLTGMTKLHHLDLFDTPVTDLSPLSETKKMRLELGGTAIKALLPLRGMSNAKISLYKYPHERVPQALKPRLQQVRIVPIYKRHGE